MKFLVHGDSVVAMRYKYLESGVDLLDMVDEVQAIDTADELEQAIVNLFPAGTPVPEHILQQAQGLLEVITDNGLEADAETIEGGIDLLEQALIQELGPDITRHEQMHAVREFFRSFITDQEVAAIRKSLEGLGLDLEQQKAYLTTLSRFREKEGALMAEVEASSGDLLTEHARENAKAPEAAGSRAFALKTEAGNLSTTMAKAGAGEAFASVMKEMTAGTNLASAAQAEASMKAMMAVENMA